MNKDKIVRRTITWSTEDFKSYAYNLRGDSWEEYYDESKFAEALDKMINKHDAEVGITWETVAYYLDDMCLKKK